MHHKTFVIGSALLLLVSVFSLVAPNLGSEFVPRLSEGAITLNVVRLAGTTMEESIRYNTKMEQVLLEKFPDEIAQVWSRIGTAEVATDPMGTELDGPVYHTSSTQTMDASCDARRTDERLFRKNCEICPVHD